MTFPVLNAIALQITKPAEAKASITEATAIHRVSHRVFHRRRE